ncbi:CGNR zinc finger domain-containing protein [Nesterenkonia lacusekhoensis]|uniref:RNA-binding Zn ribbon-like protein n=1 Tax=Nesterenkonia lacusekhoensis TaxID=150832 RepID=A0ABS4T4N6_9MICC|nr:CGNR zinc finger domain-containing protein [Nesterenkonia lacusekhoensis]MBP2319410.1 putative RNA-binding Zn ribbon-like protein [Nesterenkonia lacusekhoensis]
MFDAEINRALTAAVDLLNTAEGQHSAKPIPDDLTSIEALKKFVAARDSSLGWTASGADRDEVDRVRDLRRSVAAIWTAEEGEAPVEKLNSLLEGVGTKVVPTSEGSGDESAYRAVPIPVSSKPADVMTASIANALQFLVVQGETGRMRTCKGADCDAAIVDLTRNRSKLFCDFGNCANRAHVRAYRARQAALRESAKRGGSEAAAKKSAAAGEAAAEEKSGRSKPSSAEKAAELEEPTSVSSVAAKEFRDRMRDDLMEKRDKKDKKSKKKGKKKSKK